MRGASFTTRMETLTTKVDESGGNIIFHHYKVKALTSPKKHKTLWDASIVTLFSEGPRKIDIRIYEHVSKAYITYIIVRAHL